MRSSNESAVPEQPKTATYNQVINVLYPDPVGPHSPHAGGSTSLSDIRDKVIALKDAGLNEIPLDTVIKWVEDRIGWLEEKMREDKKLGLTSNEDLWRSEVYLLGEAKKKLEKLKLGRPS